MHTVYLSIGSNINPETNIPRALDRLHQIDGLDIDDISTFYITTPIDRPDQASYRNGAIRLRFENSPEQLKFNVLRPIENALGRERNGDAFAPRTIDLDILLFDELTSDDPEFPLPDPDIRSRSFVAIPLAELAPHLLLPDTGEPLAALSVINDSLTPDKSLTRTLKERFIHE